MSSERERGLGEVMPGPDKLTAMIESPFLSDNSAAVLSKKVQAHCDNVQQRLCQLEEKMLECLFDKIYEWYQWDGRNDNELFRELEALHERVNRPLATKARRH